MSLLHGRDRASQRPPTGASSSLWFAAVHHAAHGVVAHLLNVPHGDLTLTCTDGYHLDRRSDRLMFATDDWPSARRAVMTVIAGDVAEYVTDSHDLISMFVLTCEIAEWATNYEPVGITPDRLRAYASVSAIARDEFRSKMSDLIAETFALVRANWDIIERVASALIAYTYLTTANVEQFMLELAAAPGGVVDDGGSHVN